MACTSASFASGIFGSPPFTDTTATASGTGATWTFNYDGPYADSPHECEVIQRMSEAYREAKGK